MVIENSENFIKKQKSEIKFKDVAGLSGVKDEIQEFVDFL